MKQSLQNRLARMQARLDEVNAALSSEDSARDLKLLRRLNQEHTEISEVLAHFDAWQQAQRDLDAAGQMLEDPDMRDFAAEEIESARNLLAAEHQTIEQLLLPRDPNDTRNAIMEIRAGTGGDESALFAGDLLRMYRATPSGAAGRPRSCRRARPNWAGTRKSSCRSRVRRSSGASSSSPAAIASSACR